MDRVCEVDALGDPILILILTVAVDILDEDVVGIVAKRDDAVGKAVDLDIADGQPGYGRARIRVGKEVTGEQANIVRFHVLDGDVPRSAAKWKAMATS